MAATCSHRRPPIWRSAWIRRAWGRRYAIRCGWRGPRSARSRARWLAPSCTRNAGGRQSVDFGLEAGAEAPLVLARPAPSVLGAAAAGLLALSDFSDLLD